MSACSRVFPEHEDAISGDKLEEALNKLSVFAAGWESGDAQLNRERFPDLYGE